MKEIVKIHLSGATSGLNVSNHENVAMNIVNNLNMRYNRSVFMFIWDGDGYSETAFTGIFPYLQKLIPDCIFIGYTENPSEKYRGDWSPIKSWIKSDYHGLPDCGIQNLENASKNQVIRFPNSVVNVNGSSIPINNLSYKVLCNDLDEITPQKIINGKYIWLQYINMATCDQWYSYGGNDTWAYGSMLGNLMFNDIIPTLYFDQNGQSYNDDLYVICSYNYNTMFRDKINNINDIQKLKNLKKINSIIRKTYVKYNGYERFYEIFTKIKKDINNKLYKK